ncbi:carbohydrate porin [Methyloradius palustris]|uniref:Porin n=1 Tax=Methyloradius palustris TaxID=2778876 RepID=A0A8D5GDM8_9PROT|nr:carbohydrate porin [Methyloradius palustris]BCM24699.1 hypothetical protein ZMTM_09580 [Methyloradius palustris]
MYQDINQKISAISTLFFVLLATAVSSAYAEGELSANTEEAWNAKFQSTVVWQKKNGFNAPYSGPNSLITAPERSYSWTSTLFLGFRPWQGGEIYFNPEMAQGLPLSDLTGLGGLSNGEMARTSGAKPTIYRARLYLKQTWNFGGEQDYVASDQNQLAGYVDRRRLVLSVGNMSVMDTFDDNAYSHDPRTQFMNWSLMANGAYDYAADSRGYSWGAVAEYFYDDWAIRAGRFEQPRHPNQLALDANIFKHYGDQVEFEQGYQWRGQPGKFRLLGFRNRTVMSKFTDALNEAALSGGVPDINKVRDGEQTKYGFGFSMDQALSHDFGVFAKASWADGQTETYAFTEIDNAMSAGFALKGGQWKRPDDTFGLALMRNGLSSARQDYLRAGGISFFIGDGALNYHPEQIVETYYSLKATEHVWLTADYQHIQNPAYNADRGPVDLIAFRAHVEY